ncbi:MAG: AI-2E family transporter [Thermoanaerobaculia bacterium]|nr:AI-2E family transporter [Thermoanaerobaculia bacterium]
MEERERQLSFSERQAKTVTAAVTLLSLAVIVAAVGGLVWLLARFLDTFSGILMPLAFAGIAALVINPYFEWLRDRIPAVVAVVVVFLTVLIPISAFLWFFGALIVGQVSDLVHHLPTAWSRFVEFGQERWPRVVSFFNETPLGQQIKEAAEGHGDSVVQGVQILGAHAFDFGTALLRGVGTALGWAVMPVYLVFFMLADSEKMGPLESYMPFLKTETRRDLAFLVNEFVRIVVSFFRGQMIVALLQGLLFAIGFSVIGLKYGFILGLVLGLLNIIPYLGSIVGLSVSLPLAFFQQGGGLWLVGAVLVVFTVVQMIEGYVLTPRIMGDRTGLHPMAIIIAVFFWGTALNGIMGMILAIPLTAFLVVFWRLAQERYVSEWV